MSPADRSSAIAQLLHETTEWGGDATANIKLRWAAASPEEIERGISVARECWAHDDVEHLLRAHRARRGADRGGS